MKTSISIPDEIYQAAEELAQKQGITVNELYTLAISNYVQSHSSSRITEKLNQCYEQQDSSLDPVVGMIQFNSLDLEEW